MQTDGNDGTVVDLVGTSANPALQYATTDDYIFFRVQLAGHVTLGMRGTQKSVDTVHVFVRPEGAAGLNPAYGFSWDVNELAGPQNHGLELTVPAETGSSWSALRMEDRDGNQGNKTVPPDFNATGDGFARCQFQTVAGLGNVTWVDLAVSYNYLESTYSGGTHVSTLGRGQNWYIQAGATVGGNDHAALTDVIGSLSGNGWSITPVPEASTTAIWAGVVCLGVFVVTRSFRRQTKRAERAG